MYDQLKWSEILNIGEYTIVVTRSVIDELDAKKYDSNPKISARAKKTLKKLEDGEGSIHILQNNPRKDTFENNLLDIYTIDDRILASIIEFRQTSNDPCILITNDTGPRLKAKSLGIVAKDLPQSLRLTTSDSITKKLNIANKRIQKLENQIPNINVSFGNGEQFIEFKLENLEQIKDDEIKDKLAFLKNKYPKMEHPSSKGQQGVFLLPPTVDQINSYNERLDVFFGDFENYLIALNDYRIRMYLTKEIDFDLSNVGTVPAKALEAYFHFPDGMTVLSHRDLPDLPSEPKPPYKPKNALDMKFIVPSYSNVGLINPPSYDFPDFTSPSIKKTNSYEVTYSIGDLKHHMRIKTNPIYISFDSLDQIKSFKIDYKILADNLPDPIQSSLNINFKLNKS
jgi:rRNA-processing protein FCF1